MPAGPDHGPPLARRALLHLDEAPGGPSLGAAIRFFAHLRGRLGAGDLVRAAGELVAREGRSPERLEPLLYGALLVVADAAPEVEVGRSEDLRALTEAVARRDLPLPLRRATAAIGGELGLPLHELLDEEDPDEAPLVLASLAVRLAELDRGDPEPWLDFYADLPADVRSSMLQELLAALDRGALPSTPGRALAPLFAAEPDPALRRDLVAGLEERPDAEAALVLREWRELARSREERQALREAMRRLAHQGVAVPRDAATRIEAWATGCDGAGTYTVGLGFRPAVGPPTTVVAELDLRAGLLRASRLAGRPEELEREISGGGRRSVGALAPAEAVLRIRAGHARRRELGRPLPEDFAEEVEPWLERVPVLGSAETPPVREDGTSVPPARTGGASAPPVSRSRALRRARRLFDEPAFDDWLHAPERPEPEASVDLEAEIERPGVRAAVAERLEHQADVYARAGRPVEARACALTARAVREEGLAASPLGPSFLRRSRERLEDLAATDSELPAGLFRDELRHALEWRWDGFSRGRPPQASHLLQLDLAEAVRERLEHALEELPSPERPPAADLVDPVLELAGLAVERSRRRQHVRRRVLHTRADLAALDTAARRLFSRLSLPDPRRRRLAREAVDALARFGDAFCAGLCPVGCPDDLAAPVPELFFGFEHPVAARERVGRALFWQAPSTPGPVDLEGDGPEAEGPEAHAPEAEDAATSPSVELAGMATDVLEELAELGLEATVPMAAELERFAERLARLDGEVPLADHGKLGRTARRAFHAAAAALPAPLPTSDPDTPAAAEAFARAAPALGSDAAMRLFVWAEHPSQLVSLILTGQTPETLEDTERLLAAFQDLWNHTPRPALDGRTPAQALAAAEGEGAPGGRGPRSRGHKRR